MRKGERNESREKKFLEERACGFNCVRSQKTMQHRREANQSALQEPRKHSPHLTQSNLAQTWVIYKRERAEKRSQGHVLGIRKVLFNLIVNE